MFHKIKDYKGLLILALIVFFVNQLFLLLLSYFAELNYFHSLTWLRWDSWHYTTIANTGYEYFLCDEQFSDPNLLGKMCGNTSWFPGYPYFLKLLSFISFKVSTLGHIISKLFLLLSIFISGLILNLKEISLRNTLLLSCGAFCFGFIYYNATFPISMVLFFALLSIYFFLKEKLQASAITCFITAFVYSTGFLISVILGTYLLIHHRKNLVKFIKKSTPLILAGLFGVLSFYTLLHFEVGDWQAFMRGQEKYGHGILSPLKNMGNFLIIDQSDLLAKKNIPVYQSILVIVGYVFISIWFFVKKMHHNTLFLITYIYLTIYFLFPWTVGGSLSMYRAESMLFPFIFLLKDVKTKWLIGLLLILISIGIPMCFLFFDSTLV